MFLKNCKKAEIFVGMLAAITTAAIVSACSSAPDKESIFTDVEAPFENIAPNEIIYREIPMNKLLEYSQSEIKAAFGEPLKSDNSFILYENASFFFEQKSNKMEGINIRELKELSVYGFPDSTLEELSKFETDSEDKSGILKKELGVEPILYSYQNGAYKFEYDLAGYTMLSVCGEYSSVPHSAWFLRSKPIESDKLCYNGISVSTLFDLSYDDVLSIYGEPSADPFAPPEIYGGDGYFYESLCFPYEDITFTFSRESGKLSSIEGLNVNFVTVNGIKFGDDPDVFSAALGKPVMSDSHDGLIGSLYELSNISMEVISDSDGVPVSVKLNSSENKVPYNVETLVTLINGSSELVYYTLGVPIDGSSIRGYIPGGGTERYIYDEDFFVDFDANDPIAVRQISFLPQNAAMHGKTLDKAQGELEDILGTPDYEGYLPNGYYGIDYFFEDYGAVLSFGIPEYGGNPEYSYIGQYREEDYFVETEPEPEEDTYCTADGYTLTVGSTVFAKEGILGTNYVEGYVKSIDGDKAKIVWQYIYSNNLWGYKKYELYAEKSPLGTTYKYYDSLGEEFPLINVKSTCSISKLYAELPGGGTVIDGLTVDY